VVGGIGNHRVEHPADARDQCGIVGAGEADRGSSSREPGRRFPAGHLAGGIDRDQPRHDERAEEVDVGGDGKEAVIGYEHHRHVGHCAACDTVNGTAEVATRGVRTVDTPAHLAKAEANYDDGALFGNLAAAYTSRRNVTYTGDVTVAGYTLVDAAIGYRFPPTSTFADVEIQVNAVNLLDKRYIAALGSGQFFNTASSLNNTLQAGSPRQVFGTVRRRF